MHDYKTEGQKEAHEEALSTTIAKALSVSEETLAEHPYKRDGSSILWLENGPPPGVTATSRVTELPNGTFVGD